MICTGPMAIQTRKDERASLSPYWLCIILLPLMPNTLKPPYVTDTFLSLCHICTHMN